MTTVEQAHPFVVLGAVDPLRPWRADVVGNDSRLNHEDEDLDALPVDEQAAIVCSIYASSRAGQDIGWSWLTEADYHETDPGYCFALKARDAVNDAALDWNDLDACRDQYGEAEARIRNGEVRP